MRDVEVAATAARAAAAVLTGLREEGRLTGRELGDAGDAAAQAAITGVLTEWRPDDAVLSEEAVDDRRRLTADRVWIVDPLDGTREYGEAPRPDWAVHVALWAAGELTAAAVALPALGDVLVGWLLLRRAQVALDTLDGGVANRDRAFYEGKVAVARFFATTRLPLLSAERSIVEHADDALMELAEDAF